MQYGTLYLNYTVHAHFVLAIQSTVSLTHTHTQTRLRALCPGLPGWAGIRKVKPIRILLKQETVSGSGINWAICKSALHSRHTATPAPHHSVFLRPDALPAAQPTTPKHWRQTVNSINIKWNEKTQSSAIPSNNVIYQEFADLVVDEEKIRSGF